MYKLTTENYVIKNSNIKVPVNVPWCIDNPDFQAYQIWLAEGGVPLPSTPPTVLIPQIVTMRQARLALLAAGLLDAVEVAISEAGPAARIEWEYAQEVQRHYGLVPLMAAALDMTDTQIDILFVQAAAL